MSDTPASPAPAAAVALDDGEQKETVIYKEEATLYRFDSELKEWKQRGKGHVRFLQHNETKKIRIILRQNKTLKIRMNHHVAPEIDIKPNAGSDRSWTWSTLDFADEAAGKIEVFAIRFANTEVANKFKDMYEQVRKANGGETVEFSRVDDVEKKEEEEADVKEEVAAAPAESEAAAAPEAATTEAAAPEATA